MLLRRWRAKGDPFSGLLCLSWAFEPQEGRKMSPAIRACSSRKRKVKAPKLCFPYQRCQIDTRSCFSPIRAGMHQCKRPELWEQRGCLPTSLGPPATLEGSLGRKHSTLESPGVGRLSEEAGPVPQEL